MICSYSTPFKAGVGRHFDPRSPRGERRMAAPASDMTTDISIHAPRGGSDTIRTCIRCFWLIFLSTLPARGATIRARPIMNFLKISIHAPREGSDRPNRTQPTKTRNFYPRSPRGERLSADSGVGNKGVFLSTLPARGATCADVHVDKAVIFLSTLPARGATLRPARPSAPASDFYPRSPRGERHNAVCSISEA